MLALPIAWKGTITQYAGRLHRPATGKHDAHIYDYVDTRIPVLDRMYHKRERTYRSLGYQIETGQLAADPSGTAPATTLDARMSSHRSAAQRPAVPGHPARIHGTSQRTTPCATRVPLCTPRSISDDLAPG